LLILSEKINQNEFQSNKDRNFSRRS